MGLTFEVEGDNINACRRYAMEFSGKAVKCKRKRKRKKVKKVVDKRWEM